jgi:hypothetical protein
MKIYIMPDSKNPLRVKYLQELALVAQPKIHTLSDNPEEADIIIITRENQTNAHINLTEPHVSKLLDKYLSKCYTITQTDQPLFALAGLYASGSKSFWFVRKHLIRGCSYVYSLYEKSWDGNKFVETSKDIDIKKKYLFSFVGASNSWVRKRLLKLKLERSDILIRCTNHYSQWDVNYNNREAIQKSYVDVIRSSQFVLCPRGIGSGSIRLFEVMKLGVAPVIISDRWLPPQGPDWDSFALFVKESDIKNIVQIVESHSSEYEERGRLAKKAWEEYFSDTVVFNRCIEALEGLKEDRIPLLDQAIIFGYPIMLTVDKLKSSFRKWMRFVILKFFSLFKLQFPYELTR